MLAAAAAPVVAQNAWSLVAQNVATEATGIAVNPDGKTAFMAAGSNGSGSNVLKSTDGGATWGPSTDPTELLLLDVTSFGTNVLAAATFSELFSNDTGSTFYNSAGQVASTAQCVRNLMSNGQPIGFGIVGDFGLFNPTEGVAISTDGGATFTSSNAAPLMTEARYGAFVSPTTWYVSAGQWPESNNDQPSDQPPTTGTGTGTGTGSAPAAVAVQSKAITSRMSVHYNSQEKTFSREMKKPVLGGARPLNAVGGRALQAPSNTSYAAQLVKTTDGGNTWTSQYYAVNGIGYFNGIDCLDEDSCCVAAECDGPPCNTAIAASILCTTNGGSTWNMNYATNVTGASLLDLRVAGPSSYWAVGGVEGETGSAAVFLYSGDSGATWSVDSVLDGVYATSVDCQAPGANSTSLNCLSTVIDTITQSSSVAGTTLNAVSKTGLRAGAAPVKRMTPKEKAIKRALVNRAADLA